MKKLLVFLCLLVASSALAQHVDTTNTVPSQNSSFITNLQSFLKYEDANRYSELGFPSLVVSGGVHTTGAGLTKTPTSMVAYPGGYRITETGSITYPSSSTCYVIADYTTTGNNSTFTRVTGTHYLIDCASVSEPTTPTNAVRLMTVVTDGSSVTTATDRRILTVVSPTATGAAVGDLLYGDTTTTIGRLADVATGNALLSGGVGVAPAYGKVGLTTHISGILAGANGGTNNGFMDFTGPTTSLKTFTLPNSSATILTDVTTRVKSYYWNAKDISADGTQCAQAALATINSGPALHTIICADNDASTMYGQLKMPDNWDAGTVTFQLMYVQTAADTNVLNGDVTAMCRGTGETIDNTWGTEIAMDDAAVTGSSGVDNIVSAAVTPNGTCVAGDFLIWRWQMDATGTTTAVATLHFLGMKMEYTVTGYSE